jgi:amidase
MRRHARIAVAIAVAVVIAITVAWAAAITLPRSARQTAPSTRFSVVEASIADMRAALAARRTTSREIVQQSLDRIARHEGRLNAAIAINPRALDEADALDRERRAGRVRGPLHGIPIALKDNIHTTDMPTTGGALVFARLVPPYEATLTRNLRDAGAIIIAKTVLTELANWVATSMPTNYGSLAGFGFNPYDPRPDPRPGLSDGRPVLATGGSSSGIGTAASFWAANVGTETSGSILSPANQTMLVGIKPTVGRISRHGVIPITADQDTPGPLARSVTDAALLLGALEGATPDPRDPATRTCTPPLGRDYTRFLRAGALKGARIGIPRAYYYDAAPTPGTRGLDGGLSAAQSRVMVEAIAVLRAEGATVVDPSDVPSMITANADANLLLWPICSGTGNGKGRDEGCSIVFKYGMKRDFTTWLASLGAATPVKTLAELRAWNREHESDGALQYGQAQLDISDEMDVERDRARYIADRAKDVRLTGPEGIDAALEAHTLDALVFPGASGAAIAARPGYPTVIVPFGTIANAAGSFPPGFDPKPAPFGVSFTAGACSEPTLLRLAFAFERATNRRRSPMLD